MKRRTFIWAGVAASACGSADVARTEALRLHDRMVELLAEQASQLPDHVGHSLAAAYPTGAAVSIGSLGRECLAVGMSWHTLHGDDERAFAAFDRALVSAEQFSRVAQWLRERAHLPNNGVRSDRTNEFGAATMRDVFIALILADRRGEAEAAAALHAEPGVIRDIHVDHYTIFSRHLAALLRGETQLVRREDYESAEADYPTPYLDPYEEVLLQIAQGDAAGLAQQIPALAGAYRARPVIAEEDPSQGFSREGQLMSFDSYGTALIKLGRWHGLDVSADSDAHPGVFILPRGS